MSADEEMSVDDDPAVRGARRRGRRVAVACVILIAVLFVGASSAQIVSAVFGVGVRPLPSGAPGSDARACAEGLRALSRELTDEPPAHAWGAEAPVYRACAQSPEGLDAWAAWLRLRMTAEQISHAGTEHVRELDSLRRDLSAHLPADLR